MLCTTGQQFKDWSAACRLFSTPRFDPEKLFAVARRTIAQRLDEEVPFVVSIDDTHLRKTGKKVHGAAWKRDAMGPPFQTNFIWAQRFLQISACLPAKEQPGPATSVPVAFLHTPSPKKPRKDGDQEEWAAYKQASKEMNLGVKAAEQIKKLRDGLDKDGQAQRLLWVNGDGGYTNEKILRVLPERSIFTGRIRKDAALHFPPVAAEQTGGGRKRSYGRVAPTPEELRQDESHPWQTVEAWAAGKVHAFRVKTLEHVQWRTAGAACLLRLVVIAPLGYRLRKNAKLLYRQPAYLICTDPDQPLDRLLQYYLWRWGIEVNHRDEKQLIGVGDAQVRTRHAAANVPAFLVAAYAFLRLAARIAGDESGHTQTLPPPRWNRRYTPQPASSTRVIQQLRTELWGKALGHNFYDFVNMPENTTKPQKCKPELASAVLYAA
jgi:hypothetical protein